MPFYVDPLDEEKAIDGTPVTTGAPSSVITGGGGEGAQVTGEKNPGNFVGIQQYIAQNKPQTANLASNIASNVESEAGKAKSTIEEQSSAFGTDVGKSQVNLNKPLLEEAKSNAVSVANDPTKLAQFRAMRDANYQGPQSFESTDYFNKANEAAKKAQNLSGQLSNEEGQKQILKGMQKQTNLNKGALTLDSALLSSDPNAQQKLLGAQQSTSGLSKQLSDVSSAGNLAAQKAKQSTGITAEAIRNAFTGANSPQAVMEADIDSRVKTARQGFTSAEDINKAFAAGGPGLTDQQLTNIGLTREQVDLIRNNPYIDQSNLGRFEATSGSANNITAGNIASAEEYAKQAALNSLMGTNSTYLSTPEQAGKAQTTTAKFDLKEVSKEIGAALERKLSVARDAANKASQRWIDVTGNAGKGVAGFNYSNQKGIVGDAWRANEAAKANLLQTQKDNEADYKKYSSLK